MEKGLIVRWKWGYHRIPYFQKPNHLESRSCLGTETWGTKAMFLLALDIDPLSGVHLPGRNRVETGKLGEK